MTSIKSLGRRIAVALCACALALMLGACGNADDAAQKQNTESGAASTAQKSSQDTTAPSSSEEEAVIPAEGACYVVSGAEVLDTTGDTLSTITYKLDERGATLQCATASSEDGSTATWDYKVDADGLPSEVEFSYEGEDGQERYGSQYSYEGLTAGLPERELTSMNIENEEGEVEAYEALNTYSYEDGFVASAQTTTTIDGEENAENAMSCTYDAATGMPLKYVTAERSVTFKPKKDADGRLASVGFTVDGSEYVISCAYDEAGNLTQLAFSPKGSGDGFTLQATYRLIDDPYPWVRANSRAFIWNGMLAELGL